jgi:glycosyltransferase involved in cell wall biosynthesis
MHNKRFLTIFPRFEPVLLHKEVGAIPFFLAKTCGWKSSLAYFQSSPDIKQKIYNENYDKVVTMILLGDIGNKFKNTIRIVRFLVFRARKFDVINIYHDSLLLLACAVVYKIFNSSGRVYCKLDMSHLELEIIIRNKNKIIPSLKRRLRYIVSRIAVDLYSVESTLIYRSLNKDYYFRDRLYYSPSGFSYNDKLDLDQVIRDKENIILTVGRLGSYQKHNELLIDAATRVDKDILRDWKIYFVGPIDNEEFLQYKDNAISKHPHLKDILIFTGNISDREQLFDLFKKSKVFCLTSRWESFGLVLAEAMFFANYIISSDLPPSRDMTKEGTIGSLVAIGDTQKFAELLSDAISGKMDLIKNGMEAHELIRTKFNWENIVKELDQKLIGLMEG